MANSVRTRGFRRARRNLGRMSRESKDALGWAMYTEALHIMADSVPRTPVVSGNLRNSNYVTHPNKKPSLRLGYGAKHALKVHEGITTPVDQLSDDARKAFWAMMNDRGATPPGWRKSEVGGPKFLQHAMDATKPGRRQRVTRTAQRLLRQGVRPLADASMPRSAAAGRRNARGATR